MQRHRGVAGVQEQGIGKRRGFAGLGVIAQGFDEAPALVDQRLDQWQFVYALKRYPLRSGEHQAGGIDHVGVFATGIDQCDEDQSHRHAVVGITRFEQRRKRA